MTKSFPYHVIFRLVKKGNRISATLNAFPPKQLIHDIEFIAPFQTNLYRLYQQEKKYVVPTAYLRYIIPLSCTNSICHAGHMSRYHPLNMRLKYMEE